MPKAQQVCCPEALRFGESPCYYHKKEAAGLFGRVVAEAEPARRMSWDEYRSRLDCEQEAS